jgi:hypothetical protein
MLSEFSILAPPHPALKADEVQGREAGNASRNAHHLALQDLSPLERSGKVGGWVTRRTEMAARIVVGVFQSEGIAEDARNRLQTEGVPAGDMVLKVLKEIGLIPEAMEPELDAGFLGPMMLGNFRQDFAQHIRNGETLLCVRAPTDEWVELAVDTLKQYAPLEVKVVPPAEDPNG